MRNDTQEISDTNKQLNSTKNQLGMYSEVMRMMDERLLSKGLITKENLEKSRKKEWKSDDTIEVTFFRRKC